LTYSNNRLIFRQMNENKLYNKGAFGLPKMVLPNGAVVLTYSGHARTAAMQPDRFGIGEKINLPKSIDMQDCEVVEAEMQKGKLTPEKIVVRYPYSDSLDLVMPMHLDGFVRTVWLNDKNDKHHTLNKSRYARP
jgi:hypothetical protein